MLGGAKAQAQAQDADPSRPLGPADDPAMASAQDSRKLSPCPTHLSAAELTSPNPGSRS